MRPDIKKDFSRFFKGKEDVLYFTAHSHHFWPDVTCGAQQQAWEDAAALADKKWPKVFDILKSCQDHIARVLSLPDAKTICFAPNTHEFVNRLLSCFDPQKKVRILTTNSEFYSFSRQINRLEEAGSVDITRIETMPFESFQDRFIKAIQKDAYDLIFLSQVFYDSGFVVPDMEAIVRAVQNKETFIVIDGYHGFMARPTDLSAIADRAFYIAGGYKYAMAGEGACFMHCPEGFGLRPLNTGWFADVDEIEKDRSKEVRYAEGGMRFMGATFDPSGIYRMTAVFDWLESKDISVHDIHQHVLSLQQYFIEHCPLDGLLEIDQSNRGNFLVFEDKNVQKTIKDLEAKDIMIDARGNRLRFGFGIYHDKQDIDELIKRLGQDAV